MADLLLELFSEEIPARMQRRAGDDLVRLVGEGLTAAGLDFASTVAQSTPRRLMLLVTGLAAQTPDISEERRGPKVGAPDKAVDGFCKSAGVERSALEERETDKGAFYFAKIEKKGAQTADIIAALVPDVIRKFPWLKSMRWGAASTAMDSLKWVRPLHSIICLFGGKVVPFEVGGLKAGDVTYGHRFHDPGAITVTGFDDYVEKIAKAHVIFDPAVRELVILKAAKEQCEAKGLELVEDAGLLAEVAGLVEWPVVLMGEVAGEFRTLPPEVLQSSMKIHQKFFTVKDGAGTVTNFITVANLAAPDGGTAILAGNERVLAARLADARFFWDTDRQKTLEEHAAGLDKVIFHAMLGFQADRVERIAELARIIAAKVGADPDLAERATRLCKADLLTEMVGEFPELQGVMGRYYASAQGEPEAVANAIEQHYWPTGQGAPVPSAPISIAVALADKLDTLVCFWIIGEKPTGSKDPFALRRAALGVIRTILSGEIRVNINELTVPSISNVLVSGFLENISTAAATIQNLDALGIPTETIKQIINERTSQTARDKFIQDSIPPAWAISNNLLGFFADRLKVHLRESGIKHDRIDAVFALENQDDLWLVVERVKALDGFLSTGDGGNLLTGYKRAANILRAEEKNDGPNIEYSGAVDPNLFSQDEERSLNDAVARATAVAGRAIAQEDFTAAMAALAQLRGPVDAFFDEVTVNADDAAVRRNRLCLLNQIRATINRVADFSKIEG